MAHDSFHTHNGKTFYIKGLCELTSVQTCLLK